MQRSLCCCTSVLMIVRRNAPTSSANYMPRWSTLISNAAKNKKIEESKYPHLLASKTKDDFKRENAQLDNYTNHTSIRCMDMFDDLYSHCETPLKRNFLVWGKKSSWHSQPIWELNYTKLRERRHEDRETIVDCMSDQCLRDVRWKHESANKHMAHIASTGKRIQSRLRSWL